MVSEKHVHRARMTLAFQEAKRHRGSFRVLEITPRHVLFFFGGYEIEFKFCEGDVVRTGKDHVYLHPEDYAMMFIWAEMLMKANIAGLNKNIGAEKQSSYIEQSQLQLPFLHTGQPPVQ